jgi:hypothetical protein
VLDVVEKLHNVAEHPDIEQVSRYGRDLKPGGQSPAGVCLRYQSGSEVYIWASADRNPAAVVLPEPVASRRLRIPHAIRLLVQLLDTARPELFTAWRTVGFPDLDMPQACALELKGRDGSSFILRFTAGSAPTDPDDDPAPGYLIPEAVKTCLQGVNVGPAARG